MLYCRPSGYFQEPYPATVQRNPYAVPHQINVASDSGTANRSLVFTYFFKLIIYDLCWRCRGQRWYVCNISNYITGKKYFKYNRKRILLAFRNESSGSLHVLYTNLYFQNPMIRFWFRINWCDRFPLFHTFFCKCLLCFPKTVEFQILKRRKIATWKISWTVHNRHILTYHTNLLFGIYKHIRV